jgi:preprotein translocase, SecE subunit, bacterial
MGRIIRYFKGVGKEAKRIRWPKKDVFLPAIITVVVITAFAAIFLLVEDLAAGTLIQQLRDAFSSIRG